MARMAPMPRKASVTRRLALVTLLSLGCAGLVACSGGASSPGPTYGEGTEPAGGGEEPGSTGQEPGTKGNEPTGGGGYEPPGGGSESPGGGGSSTGVPSGSGGGQGSSSGTTIGSSSGSTTSDCVDCTMTYTCTFTDGTTGSGSVTVVPVAESDGCLIANYGVVLECGGDVVGLGDGGFVTIGSWEQGSNGGFTASAEGDLLSCSP